MTRPVKHWTNSFSGVLLGIVALTIVTAILASAVSSLSASRQVGDLVTQLGSANRQLDELRANNTDSEARSARAQRERADLMAQNKAVQKQNRALQRQVNALVDYLRGHGITVPQGAAAPADRPSARPHPGKSKPRPPSKPNHQPSHSPTGVCAIAPTLCPLRIPAPPPISIPDLTGVTP